MAYRQFDQPNTPEIPKTPEYGLYNQAFLQAMSNQHQRAENEKQRANARAVAEIKKPSFKISEAASPFSIGQKDIGSRVNRMLDPSVTPEEKEYLNQQNIQQAARDKAQQTQLTAIGLNAAEAAKKYGDAADMSIFNKKENKIRTEDNTDVRDNSLIEYADLLGKPEEWVVGDKLVMNYFNTIKPLAPTYKSSKESGLKTNLDESVAHTRFPLDGEPILDSNGQQLMNNGVPLYKKRIANNPRELLGYANTFLENNSEYSDILHKQTAKKYKTDFEKEVNNWANTFDTPPSEEEKESFKKGLVANKTRNDIAEKFYKNDKAFIDANSKVSFDEPTEADNDRNFSQSWGANGSYSTTFTSANYSGNRDAVFVVNGDKKEGKIKTYGELGIARRDKNNEPKPVIIRTDEGAWNASRGEKIKQGLEMNVGGIVLMVIDEKTGLPLPTNKTVAQLKKEGKKFAPFLEGKMLLGKENKAIKKEDVADYEQYVALNNKPYLSTDNNGVNEQEEFNKLEAKFAKQGQSSYVMKKLDNKIANQLAKKDIDGFFNLNDENRKLKKELDDLNKKTTVTKVKGVAAPTNPDIKLSLIDQIKKEMPNATPEQWVSEYKKRSK